jgi:hypothetical protein
VPSVPVSCHIPEQRTNELKDTLNWLRSKGIDHHHADLTGEFCKLESTLPTKLGQMLEERAQEIEGTLDWIQNKGVGPDSHEALPSFDKHGSIPLAQRTPEERKKDLKDSLNWILSEVGIEGSPRPRLLPAGHWE